MVKRTRASTGRPVPPGAPARPPSGNVRAWALAAAGLALAGTMLVCSLPPAPADETGAEPSRPGPPPAEQVDDDGGIGVLTEPEVCEGGRPVAASWSPDQSAGDAVSRIQEADQLVVGVDQSSYLWGYRRPDTAELVGFDIDLVQAIAESLLGENPRVLYRAIPTDQRISQVADGQVDMVVRTMSMTCERWSQVAFSTAYFEAGQQLLVPRHSEIDGFDASLAGARVCSADGSTARELLDRESHGAELISAPNHLDCLVLMQLGEADALMTDSALAAGHAAQDPSMHLVGEPLTREPYGVAMNLEDVDLVRWVNAVLEEYREGGWQAAYDEWLEEYLPEDASPAPPDPVYRD